MFLTFFKRIIALQSAVFFLYLYSVSISNWPNVWFEGINFGVDGNVFVCKYGFHSPENFLSHSNSPLYFCVTHCILWYGISQIFEDSYLFYFLSTISHISHIDISNIGALESFEMIMHSILLTFSSAPFSTLLTVAFVTSVWRFCSESAMSTVSSAYRKLLILFPPTLTPWCSLRFLRIISLYKLKRSRDATQPWLAPWVLKQNFESPNPMNSFNSW